MEARCRCGTEVQYSFHHFGCIQCGAPCCPTCSLELESVAYCGSCARALLDRASDPRADLLSSIAG
jgi:hypothetical protein